MITRFPVLVLANYRTGSSTLTHNLFNQYNLEFFSEPLRNEEISEELMQRLANKVKNKENNFIVKFMPDQVNDCQLYQDIYNSDCYKIKLQRRDKIAQIASYYACYVTGIWHSDNPARRGEKLVLPIYNDDIDFSINLILDNDRRFAEMDTKFDQELYYEDLNLQSDTFSKLDAPSNYHGICSYIKHRMQKKGLQI
jgi:LPS sulfotransferase NodH